VRRRRITSCVMKPLWILVVVEKLHDETTVWQPAAAPDGQDGNLYANLTRAIGRRLPRPSIKIEAD
jgi:hypothetical protein